MRRRHSSPREQAVLGRGPGDYAGRSPGDYAAVLLHAGEERHWEPCQPLLRHIKSAGPEE